MLFKKLYQYWEQIPKCFTNKTLDKTQLTSSLYLIIYLSENDIIHNKWRLDIIKTTADLSKSRRLTKDKLERQSRWYGILWNSQYRHADMWPFMHLEEAFIRSDVWLYKSDFMATCVSVEPTITKIPAVYDWMNIAH